MSIGVGAGEVMGGVALILSGYAIWKTSRLEKQHQALKRSQERMDHFLEEKETERLLLESKADLGAEFVKDEGKKPCLRIWNKGKGQARNVRIEFPEGNSFIVQAEVDQIFPLETLDSLQSVEISAVTHMVVKRKNVVRLLWSDNASEHNEKFDYPIA